MQRESSSGYITRAPRSSGLADVLEILLDRGLVIASVDTYLRFAEAVNRLDLQQATDAKGLPDLFKKGGEEMAEHESKGAVEGGMDAIKEKIGLGGRGGDDDEDEEKGRSRSRSGSRSNDR